MEKKKKADLWVKKKMQKFTIENFEKCENLFNKKSE